jgi:hypothetical protein
VRVSHEQVCLGWIEPTKRVGDVDQQWNPRCAAGGECLRNRLAGSHLMVCHLEAGQAGPGSPDGLNECCQVDPALGVYPDGRHGPTLVLMKITGAQHRAVLDRRYDESTRAGCQGSQNGPVRCCGG